MSCGLQPGSVLGPLMSLNYGKNMITVKSVLFLNANDSCQHTYQQRDHEEIKKQLSKDFENVCFWFFDNKLRIHFGEDKPNIFLLQVSVTLKVHKI